MAWYDDVWEGVEDVGGWLGGAVEDIWGGLTGQTAATEAREQAARMAEQAYGEWEGIEGFMDPQLFLQQGIPYMGMAQADPQAIAAQRRVLERLEQLGTGEMTPEDLARMQLARQQTGTMLRGAREAAMQQAAARGMAGGGQELAAILSGQQAAAQSQAQQEAQMNIAAQQRAMQALQSAAGLGTSMRGTSFEEEAQRRRALDVQRELNRRERIRQEQEQFNRQMGVRSQRHAARLGQVQQAQQAQQQAAQQQAAQTAGLFGIAQEII